MLDVPSSEFNAWLQQPLTKLLMEFVHVQRIAEREACVQQIIKADVDKARISAARESVLRDLVVLLRPREDAVGEAPDTEFKDPNALETA